MKLQKLTEDNTRIALVVGLVLLAVIIRLLPLPPNFAPITAVAIFGGALLPGRFSVAVPLAAMIVSDLFLGLHSLIWATWGGFALIALMSSRYVTKNSPTTVLGASVGASILFFVITNFAVWLEGRLYAPTLEGLVSSYVNAVPFFRNTLLSDLFFTITLFGAYALAYKVVARRTYASEQVA